MLFLKLITGGFLLYLLLSAIEQKFLVTTKYNITSSKLGKEFDGLKLVVLSDLHNHSFGRQNDRLVKRIGELSPDIIIISGDMITKHKPCIPGNAYNLLENLVKKYPVYYAYGNHEQRFQGLKAENPLDEADQMLYSTWIEYLDRLKNFGVNFLDNNAITLIRGNSKIRISGISIEMEYFKHFSIPPMEKEYLNSLLRKKEEDAFQILIAHNPVYFHNYIDWGADLILSGHLHGGIVRLPFIGGLASPQVNFFPNYDSGSFHENNQVMIVSRGLGSHSFMPRLFNPPEIVYVQINSNYSRKEQYEHTC